MVDAIERQLGALRGEDAPFYADRFLDKSSRGPLSASRRRTRVPTERLLRSGSL